MNDLVIRVENLGKLYRIGSAKEKDKTFREAMRNMISAPWWYMKNPFREQPVTKDEKSDYYHVTLYISYFEKV